MGQYYFPLLVDDTGGMYRAVSHDFDNGLKLMEHSWVGNNFVNAILGMVEERPMRLAWIGDYSESVVKEDTDFGGGFVVGSAAFEPYYGFAMKDQSAVTTLERDTPQFLFDMDHPDCFLINTTKQVYVDLERYVSDNLQTDNHGFNPYCINPVPLLTCIGNGQGGGDYFGDEGKTDVGTWAFDKIYVSAIRPAIMKEVEFHFSER